MRTKLITLILVSVVFVTAIIAQQYERVVKIYKDGEVLNSYVVSEIDSIKFDRVSIYEIGVESSPAIGGMATINGVQKVQLLKEGDIATLNAVASAGYTFIGWSKDGEIFSAENPYITTVDGAATYVANFEQGANYCYPTGNIQHSVRHLSNFTLTDGFSEVKVEEIQLGSFKD